MGNECVWRIWSIKGAAVIQGINYKKKMAFEPEIVSIETVGLRRKRRKTNFRPFGWRRATGWCSRKYARRKRYSTPFLVFSSNPPLPPSLSCDLMSFGLSLHPAKLSQDRIKWIFISHCLSSHKSINSRSIFWSVQLPRKTVSLGFSLTCARFLSTTKIGLKKD